MKRREPNAPPAATAATPQRTPSRPAPAGSGVRERVSRTNLAHGPTRFVGRRRELSELRTLLAEQPLVTVTGAAGVGKSRLASELARLLVDEYVEHGGAWRVDLEDVRDLDGLCAAVAWTLGIGFGAGIGQALSARGTTLLLLDGADGCVGALSRLLPEWAAAAPAVRWIVTARAPLGLERETRLELGALTTVASSGGAPDAVWLFVDRARTAGRDLVLDGKSEREILELVRRFEGLPLAIELVAASAGAFSPAELLEREARAKSSSLRTAVGIAWDALQPWQRDALAQASVFAGGFDLEAADAVLDLSAHPGRHVGREAIDSLRRHALLGATLGVEEGGAPRLAMSASVREHARERLLEVGGRDAAIARHATYYARAGVERARRHEGPEPRAALAWLSRESHNLFAAHRRMLLRGREGAALAVQAALALDPLLSGEGPGSLRLAMLDAALSVVDKEGLDPELRMRVLEARSDTHRLLGRGQEAALDAQAALTIATERGPRTAVARVLRGLATIAMQQGKVAECRGLVERGMSIAREEGDRVEEGRAFGLLGSAAALEGRSQDATRELEHAIALHRETGDLRHEAMDTGNLAVVAHDAGLLDEARAACDRALFLYRASGDRRLEAEANGLLATVAHEQQQVEEAGELYEQALLLARHVGSRRAEGALLGYQGMLLAETDDIEGARAAYGRALTILRESRDRSTEALVLGALSAVEAREGCLDSARAALARATEALEGIAEPRARAALEVWRGHVELLLARLARADGDEARAKMLHDAAVARIEATPVPERGECRRAADVRLARRALERAIARAAEPVPASGPRSDRPEGEVESVPADLPGDAFVVSARGLWFRMPHGDVVSIARWRPLQRLLERLAERRETAPGEPLTVDALISAGWPGERMLPKAGATRVYTAIATLRRLGLRELLLRDDRGYMLRADVPIARVSRG
ncbi:MAG TPA: AAA family ATPase [Polyangiaceae bacterium]